jgi:peptidoglycan-N-acetylglucosamine deacetylase
MLELPRLVGESGSDTDTVLEGSYLRCIPTPLTRRFLRSLGESAAPWSYSHPYDLDPEEPFFVMSHVGWLTSRIVHTRRGATLPRLEAIIAAAGEPWRPLEEIAQDLAPVDPPPTYAG